MQASSGAEAGLLGLPQGGGVSPQGDRFQPDLTRGSGSYTVPLPMPTGPADMSPKLTLAYGTGSGNGPFGLGWRLELPRIERRTDRGIPLYDDALDSFVLNGVELLVDVGGGRFRPQVDNQSWLIERDGDGWRIRTGTGGTMYLGTTGQSREEEGERVFAWLIDKEVDPAGNETTFVYDRADGRLTIETIGWSVFETRFILEDRPDPVRNGRAGFLRTQNRRCAAIEIHSLRAAPSLLRTHRFSYATGGNGLSLLAKVELVAERNGESAALPPLTFGYGEQDLTQGDWQALTSTLAPPSLDDPDSQLADMTSDGLPDFLHHSDAGLRVWRNRGNGHFEGPVAIPSVPAAMRIGSRRVGFADLDGNGRADLFVADQPLQMAMRNDGKGGFEDRPMVFSQSPSIDLGSASTRLSDIDGDGVTDLIATRRDHLVVHRHEPGIGWSEATLIDRIRDLEAFPDLRFGDRGVRLADMTGDGLQDFVLIRGGDASYWPSLGGGRFGQRIHLEAPPALPAHYDDARLLLLDLDGDGCADIVYCGDVETTLWLNRGGSGFAAPIVLPFTLGRAGGRPPIAVDIFGSGMTAMVWAEPAAAPDEAGCVAFRFSTADRPYQLERIDNGIGGITTIAYSDTTRMAVADRAAGREWLTTAPFAIPLVVSITEQDTICGLTRRSEIHYRDPVYDGVSREFRGFSEVDQVLLGDESTPTLRQHYRYFQGDPEIGDPRERLRQRALSGTLQSLEIFEVEAGGERLRQSATQGWETVELHDGPDGIVFATRLRVSEQREPGIADPDRIDRTENLVHDAFGNLTRRRRSWSFEGQAGSAIEIEERWRFVDASPEWLVKLACVEEVESAGGIERRRETHYDGAAFEGLALGTATRGLPSRVRELHLADAALPADYLAGRDPAQDGFSREIAGAPSGWYATTMRVRRDATGNAVEERDPLGHATRTDYDADGLFPVRRTDALGHSTVYTFDPAACQPQSVETVDGRATQYSYDPLGRAAAQHERDDAGNMQLVGAWETANATLPVGIRSWVPRRGGFTPESVRQSANAPSVQHMVAYFDGFGDRIQEISDGPAAADGSATFVSKHETRKNVRGAIKTIYPERFVASTAFDAAAPETARERSRFDAHGHVVERIGPGSAQFAYQRDSASVAHFEGSAGAMTKVRDEVFDAAGKVRGIAEWVQPDSAAITNYGLTFDGRLAELRDGNGTVLTRYTYDCSGEAIRIASLDAGTRDYHRNAAERVVTMKLADGDALDYAYDAIGRPLAIRNQGAALREYEYGMVNGGGDQFAIGRLTALREPASRIDYDYTRYGRIRSERITADADSLTLAWEFDQCGGVTAVIHPDGRRIEQKLDRAGRVVSIDGLVDAVDYDADDAVSGYRLANGVTVSTERDSGRVMALEVRGGGDVLRRLDYDRDAIGGCIGTRDAFGGDVRRSRFSFDHGRRLIGNDVALGDDPSAPVTSSAYQYDAIGNIRAFGETGASFVYGDAQRPARLTATQSAAGQRSFGYDQRGHIVDMGDGTTLGFDLFDRLVRVDRADGASTVTVLDPTGRVARTTVTDPAIRIVRRAGGYFEQHQGFALSHVFLLGNRIATIRSSAGEADKVAYSIADHQGTALLDLDAGGAVIAHQRYTPFGAAIEAGTALDRYLGVEREAGSGLQRLGTRVYAAELGRFISPDWYILENPNRAMGMPQGFNVYSYALNNPVDFKDPSGRWIFVLIAIVAAVGFAVGFISGLARGKGLGESLLIGLETALTTTIGAALGAGSGALLGFLLGGIPGAMAGAIGGGLMGGINGLYTGSRQIYNWGDGSGFLAFFADSTWGLLGTSLGNVLNIYNSIAAPGSYMDKWSYRQNRQVYDRGFGFGTSAHTQGNVISNMRGRYPGTPNYKGLLEHETLHITQNRIFGPIFPVTYVVWFVVMGVIVGSIAEIFVQQGWGQSIRDMGYSNNPWEMWGYHEGGTDGKAGELKW